MALNVGAAVIVTKPIDLGMVSVLLKIADLPDSKIDEDVAATSTLILKLKAGPGVKKSTG